eukprot:CAMPEP_0178376462 /NCGR_PEP_ID=MMETSP0689_2-20121128/3416_1 /TAXON_ID=160604 /ORGANISM="Amphidinium massartii, Strain CS-259" /LENGTH=60 /DNA_ID=CAMNT_0019996487 /DNA_START=1064 /DNA_END=1242 /DNA_ORIENTATION=+
MCVPALTPPSPSTSASDCDSCSHWHWVCNTSKAATKPRKKTRLREVQSILAHAGMQPSSA